MEVIRFARAILPLAAVALLGPPGAAGPPAFAAADPPLDPPACRTPPVAGPPETGVAWYRLDQVLDSTGTLAGQRLTVGVVGRRARQVALPPESFASGPVAGVVLVGDDDGTRSRLRAVDPGRGCATTVAEEAAVIRGAILAPDGAAEMEHRVDRVTREDLGVWRRATRGGHRRAPAAGTRPGRRARTNVRDGPAVGAGRASLGRLVRPAGCAGRASWTRRAASSPRPTGPGPVLGVAAGRVIAYAPCDGFPCAIVAVDPTTGGIDTLVAGRGTRRGGRPRRHNPGLRARRTPRNPGSPDGRAGRARRLGRARARAPRVRARPPASTCRLARCCSRRPTPRRTRRRRVASNPAATRIEPAIGVLP